MQKKPNRKPKQTPMGVVVEPHRGIVYFDDSACRIKKFHNKGCRNIYSVVLTYNIPALAKKKKIMRLDYGQYQQAQKRFLIETSQKYMPSKMDMKEIRMMVSTFKGTKLINEDILRCVEYGKYKNGHNMIQMIGEELN